VSAQGEFARDFEAAFARLQVRIEEGYGSRAAWPEQVAAAIEAGFSFAAEDPAAANVLTNEALAQGPDGIARYQRLVGYAAELLRPGRALHARDEPFPEILERGLAGGLAAIVAERIDQSRAAELPALIPEAIQFALAPYVGAEAARRIARERPDASQGQP